MKKFFDRHRESRLLQLLDVLVVLVAVLIFTFTVMPNVLHASAYFDEGYSAYLAKLDLWSMANYTALDVHPPLYYAALHFWEMIAGNGVSQLRMLSVVFGWIAMVFGFLIMRRSFGRRAAWLVT